MGKTLQLLFKLSFLLLFFQEKPELEKQRSTLLSSITRDKQMLRELEDKSLLLLQKSESKWQRISGNYLGDYLCLCYFGLDISFNKIICWIVKNLVLKEPNAVLKIYKTLIWPYVEYST